MERVSAGDPVAVEAISAAEDRIWSDVDEWEFGPDALRDPWLYADEEVESEEAPCPLILVLLAEPSHPPLTAMPPA
ncbi:MAG TPA: hypothetical protein VE673_08405 [Pseudonocardiaceae bacterium]|jgi:hypothetical protein|nr:hypothetical protein [Pseudonocardiaceae bacterium]